MVAAVTQGSSSTARRAALSWRSRGSGFGLNPDSTSSLIVSDSNAQA